MIEPVTRKSFGRIRRFLRGEGFWIVLQPIADLDSGAVVGFEALARFEGQPPRSPAAWFKDASDAGLRRELELATARAAVEAIDSIPDGTWLTLNVSPDVATSAPFLATVVDAPVGRLVVEITEHAPVDDYEALNRALRSLRDKGVRVAIDDAGAGFANMTHMLRLDVDLIKLDIELTRHIDIDAKRKALVASFVEFARSTGATVVAEGIETEAELAALRRLGVPIGQGYHLGKPQALPETEAAQSDLLGRRRFWHSATTTVSDAVSFRRSRRALLRKAPRRRFARPIAALAVLAGLLVGPAASAYAEDSLPGTPGWWIKRRIEDTRLALASDRTTELRLHLTFARRRLDEVGELIARGKDAEAERALGDYLRRVEAVERYIPRLAWGAGPAGLADRIREDMADHVATLTKGEGALCGRQTSGVCLALGSSLARSKAVLGNAARTVKDPVGKGSPASPSRRSNGSDDGGHDGGDRRAPNRDPKPAKTPATRGARNSR